jgi:hypothetical protein
LSVGFGDSSCFDSDSSFSNAAHLYPLPLIHPNPPEPPLLPHQHVAAIVYAAAQRKAAGGTHGRSAAAAATWFVVYTGQEPHQQQQLLLPSFETAGDFALSVSPLSRHMPSGNSAKSGAVDDTNTGYRPSGSEAAAAIAEYINKQRCRQVMMMTMTIMMMMIMMMMMTMTMTMMMMMMMMMLQLRMLLLLLLLSSGSQQHAARHQRPHRRRSLACMSPAVGAVSCACCMLSAVHHSLTLNFITLWTCVGAQTVQSSELVVVVLVMVVMVVMLIFLFLFPLLDVDDGVVVAVVGVSSSS